MSISASKAKKVQTRNILKCPKLIPKSFTDEEIERLQPTLESCLRRIFVKTARISWNQLKTVPKEERVCFKKKLFKNQGDIDSENAAALRKEFFYVGVNEVARGLEQDDLVGCLLAGDAEPFNLVEHLVNLSQNKKIPFIVYPSLRTLTKEQLGFSSLAIGLKKGVEENGTVFAKLVEQIQEMSGSKSDIGLVVEDSRVYSELPSLQVLTPKVIIPKPTKDVKKYHLLRDGASHRVFQPPLASKKVETTKGCYLSDFSIPPDWPSSPSPLVNTKKRKLLETSRKPTVDNSLESIEPIKDVAIATSTQLSVKGSSSYIPPIVHKVQPNPRKVKKKQKIKKK